MANPPKQKGTAFENEVLQDLQHIWPDADRAKANNESQDLVGTGKWVIECKFRKRWDLFKWIGKIKKVAADYPWVIVAAHGDRRSVVGRQVGTVAVVDWGVFVEMVEHLEAKGWLDP